MDDKKLLRSLIEKDASASRLQSLKLPRDLSLGLAKPKKQHVPNVNAVRNKDKNKEMIKKTDSKRQEKPSYREKRDRSDGKPKYVELSGVFSQGGSEVKRESFRPDKRASFRDDTSGPSGMVMPTISKTEDDVIDMKNEEEVIKNLLGCDVDSDEEDGENTTIFKPHEYDWRPKESADEIPLAEKPAHLQKVPGPFCVPHKYSDDNISFSTVLLPTSFPVRRLSDDPNDKQLLKCPLHELPEGKIGKLVIRKSGEMEVQIGNIKYEFTRNDNYFREHEELGTLTQHNGQPSIAILGEVTSSFSLFPDWPDLLGQKN